MGKLLVELILAASPPDLVGGCFLLIDFALLLFPRGLGRMQARLRSESTVSFSVTFSRATLDSPIRAGVPLF